MSGAGIQTPFVVTMFALAHADRLPKRKYNPLLPVERANGHLCVAQPLRLAIDFAKFGVPEVATKTLAKLRSTVRIGLPTSALTP